MGFNIHTNRSLSFRKVMSKDDYEYRKNCDTCSASELCGGWSLWNDGRYCDKNCFDCRAICSRASWKVETALRQMELRDIAELGIVGKHPWAPFEIEVPDYGFQVHWSVDGTPSPLYVANIRQLYHQGTGNWGTELDLHKRFSLPHDSQLALTFTCQDYVLDELIQDPDAMADGCAKYGFDYVFAPNFSIYDNYPRLDNLFQLKRKYLMLERLQDRGMKVIPDVCFATKSDFLNQVAWFRDNNVRYATINFQVHASTADKERWLREVRAMTSFENSVGHPIHWFVFGASGGNRLDKFIENFKGDYTILDTRLYVMAACRKDYDGNVHKGVEITDVFRSSVERFTENLVASKSKFT